MSNGVVAGLVGASCLFCYFAGVHCERWAARQARVKPEPESVHEAMQNAPHDGKPFRMARAAIACITKGIP